MTSDELQAKQLELEERRIRLDEERAEGEKTWTHRYAGIFLPVAGTAVAAILTTGATVIATYWQQEETRRAQIASERQESVENGRAAAAMYFQNLSDLRGKDELSPGEKKRFARDLEIVAAISANDDLKPILLRVTREAAGEAREKTAQQSVEQKAGTMGPSAALLGLPDLAPTKKPGAYAADDFIAYPQVPSTRWSDAEKLRMRLAGLGFDAQPPEQMLPDRSPQKNVVRYYKPAHKALARQTAMNLAVLLKQNFEVRPVPGGANLPNGVMEFWLGTSPDAK